MIVLYKIQNVHNGSKFTTGIVLVPICQFSAFYLQFFWTYDKKMIFENDEKHTVLERQGQMLQKKNDFS